MTYARRTDTTQQPIVEALRKAGYDVYVTGRPTDLEVTRQGWGNCFIRLECKPLTGKRKPRARIRKSEQPEQAKFCERHLVPYVVSPEDALRYMRVAYAQIGPQFD